MSDYEDDSGPRLELTPRKVAVALVFIALAVVALYFLLPKLTGLNDTWKRIEKGSPAWLALALVFTVAQFLAYVIVFHGIFGRGLLTWGESWQITLAALAATRLFSAGGAGGVVLQAWALRRAGMPAREVADRSVSFIVLTYLMYTLALGIFGYGLYFGVLHGPDTFAVTFLPGTLALVVTIAGLCLAFVPPDLQRRVAAWCGDQPKQRFRRLLLRLSQVPAAISAGMRDALSRFGKRDPVVAAAAAYWAFQIAALWACFRAFGASPTVAVLVVGFFLGMLGNLLPLPGGIGGVDGGLIGAFAALGVDAGAAIVAVLTFRALTFWLPTIPGIVAYLKLRHTVEGWRSRNVSEPAGTLSYTK